MSNNSSSSEQVINGPKCIEIPRGWSRILENGSILYISPNNSRLRSLDHVIEYLKTEGTCKCGLDCPLFVQNVFNFDARIPSKLIPVGSRSEPSKTGCKHCVADSYDAGNPKQSAEVKQPSATLGQKRGPGRPCNPLSKSRRVGIRKSDLDRPTSPLHNIPLPVPSSVINSPVQSVPTNISVEQGPLPSFATIVSSSKLFNPNAGALGLGNNMLARASTAVTSAASSSPLTTASLQSSKPTITVSSIAVSSSTSFTSPAVAVSTGVAITHASETTASSTSTVTVSPQYTAAVTVQLPSRMPPENTLIKSSISPGLGVKSSTLTTSAPSAKAPSKETVSTSSITVVVTTTTATIPAAKQDVRSVSNVTKLPDVKTTPKPTASRSSKPSKPYSARKTVAATLKAAAAANAKGSVSLDVARTGIGNIPHRTQAVTPSTAVPSTEFIASKTASKQPSQVLATCTPSTTVVQAPALFHSVLKDAMKKDPGQVNRVVSSPSTSTTIPGTTRAVTSHSSKISQPVSTSSRNKSAASKETVKATTALVQGVAPIHVPPTVPQHVPSNRSQPSATGYPLVNAGSSFYCPASMASSASQQPNVPTPTMAQGTAHPPPSPATVYGQVQNTAVSSQIPSLQLTASQGQAGVFFQGNGNQVFQMNVDSNQLKGAYQLHGALYQSAIPATFLAATNSDKAAPSNAPGTVPQAMYPANPYMLGIVMPTAITQSNQSAQSVATTATSPSATAAVVAAPVASYPYSNQNAAIAAAFESFVPIAPAASPRFSQTLAHLASAYSPFLPRSAVQGSTPVQFAAPRMVPMNPMHSQAGGNGQMGSAVFNLADYTVKYPINTVKASSYTSQASTVSNVGSVNTHPQTAVVAAMPYVAIGQINNPRFPFSMNFAAPGTSTNPSASSSSTPPACSYVTSVTTSHQHSTAANVDSLGGGAVLGYVSMPVPFGTSPSGVNHLQNTPKPHPGSAFSPPSSHASASHANQRMDVSGTHHSAVPSWCSGTKSTSATATSQRRCSTPESSSSSSSSNSTVGCCSIVNSGTSRSLTSSQSSYAESNSSGMTKTSSSNCSQSPRHPGMSSPLNSPLPLPNQTLSTCRGSPKSNSPLATVKSSAESIPSGSQIFNTYDCHQAKTLSSEMPGTSKRTYSESGDQANKRKFDESAYYETNPLLGLKRSCEAIEAYCSPERKGEENDDDDDEYDFDDNPAVPKNEERSPVNHQTGEEIGTSKTCSIYNNCDQNIECNRETRLNSRESQPTLSGMEPISDKRQSHSVYNGDVSANQSEGLRENFSVQMVNQDMYLPVKTNSVLPNTAGEHLDKPRVPNIRPQFEIGDIVWAQARGLPSWPGKVVDASEVGKGRPDDGKRWVMWFGDHTFSQVEVDKLKTLSEGLRTLDDKARKKKYRAKKARIGLEQAISEALEALDMRERLRGRQGARSKTKKKRLR